MTTSNTIVYFHTGRGGSFNNAGHTTYCGQKNIEQVLQMNDSGKRNSFLSKENEHEIYQLLKKRDLENLIELFEKSRDNDDFSRFEKLTGLDLGEDVYTDCNGSTMITVAEVETGVGTLDWDGEYDRDNCILLSDCGEGELQTIISSREYDKEDTVQEYFDTQTDLNVDWKKFDGRYSELIEDYFNFPTTNIEDYYEVED